MARGVQVNLFLKRLLFSIMFLWMSDLRAADCVSSASNLFNFELAKTRLISDPSLTPVARSAWAKFVANGISERFPELFPAEEVAKILSDDEQQFLALSLARLIDLLTPDVSQSTLAAKLTEFLQENQRVPSSQIATRVDQFMSHPSEFTRAAVLGRLSLEDTAQLLHGGNPLAPHPESLLGRYIGETQAATVVRRFPRDTNYNDLVSPERLVVAVSPQTLDAFRRLLASRPEIFGQLHTPEQGTLLVYFLGRTGTYASLSQDFRFPTVGTMLPAILLSSTEGARLNQYFNLGTFFREDSILAQHPWLTGFCLPSGYSSCTHWIGNMPIGDRRVSQYTLPGRVDQYASNALLADPVADRAPRVSQLTPFQYNFRARDNVTLSDGRVLDSAAKARFLSRVWQTPDAPEQFANMLGLGEQNLAGEFANPGWVALSVLGGAPVERAPVVFVFVDNHTAPLANDFNLRIRAY